MVLPGLKISKFHRNLNQTSISLISVILFSVICRLDIANSSQPSYNQSGARQVQQTSMDKDIEEEINSTGPPMKKHHSGVRGSSSASLKSASSSFSSYPNKYYYPITGDIIHVMIR